MLFFAAVEHNLRRLICRNAVQGTFLTDNELESMSEYAILSAMNAFRITILALLVLVVGGMFYAIFVLLPGMQADRDIYEITQKTAQDAARDAGHREKVSEYGENAENQGLAGAYSEADAADRSAEQSVFEAEERAVIEEAKRKEMAAQEQKVREERDAEKTIGLVTSFNKEWVSIMFKPAVTDVINEGVIVAVRREGVVICEATVDFKDEESGQLGATLKPQEFGKSQVNVDVEKLLPQVGDEIIYSPFASARELRAENPFVKPMPLSVPRQEEGVAPLENP